MCAAEFNGFDQAEPDSWPQGVDWRVRFAPHIGSYMEGLQLSQDEVLDALDELAVLYPPEAVGAIHQRLPDRPLLAPLLAPEVIPYAEPFLLLGHDLARCSGWNHKPQILDRLRRLSSWSDQRFEVGLWAGLCREGLEVEHEPLPHGGPDFLVHDSGQRVVIEAKSLHMPDVERNRESLHEALERLLLWNPVAGERGGFEMCLTLNDPVKRELRKKALSFEAETLPSVKAAAKVWVGSMGRGRSAPSQGIIPGIGSYEVRPSEGPRWTPLILEGDAEPFVDKAVLRLISRVRDRAVRQVENVSADVRVAVVWVGGWPLEEIEQELIRRLAGQEESLASLDFVALFKFGWTEDHSRRAEIAPVALPWSRARIGDMRWPAGLTLWRYNR